MITRGIGPSGTGRGFTRDGRGGGGVDIFRDSKYFLKILQHFYKEKTKRKLRNEK